MGLLESCADARAVNNLSFSEILQEPSIEDHPAIYWAIVKRPSPDDFELITSLMSYSAPLTTETMTEVRLACLHVEDQALFQCLWRSPEYGALSGADRMLLGVSVPPDTIDVEELPGQDVPFVVSTIVQFETRMKASIAFEFVARGTPPRIRFPSPHASCFAYLFPSFATREDMETELLCEGGRLNTPAWSVGRQDAYNGAKPAYPFGLSHHHKGTGERAVEPTACSPSQQGSHIVLNLVFVVAEIYFAYRIPAQE
jgi:hypothetical protein